MSEQNQIERVVVEGIDEGNPWTASYEATGWTVDANGFLHIFDREDGTSRSVACYAPAYWGFVSRKVTDGAPDEREGQVNVVFDGKAIAAALSQHRRRGGRA